MVRSPHDAPPPLLPRPGSAAGSSASSGSQNYTDGREVPWEQSPKGSGSRSEPCKGRDGEHLLQFCTLVPCFPPWRMVENFFRKYS